MTTPDLLKFTVQLRSGREETWYLPPDVTPESLVVAARDMLEAAGVDFEIGPLAPDVLHKLVDGHLVPADREDDGDSSPEPPSSAATPADRDVAGDETPPGRSRSGDEISSEPSAEASDPDALEVLGKASLDAARSATTNEEPKPATPPKPNSSGRQRKRS